MKKKKILLYIIIVLTLVMLIVGMTYSFISLKTTNNTTVKGKYANIALDLTVEKVVGEGKLIPMDDEDLATAIEDDNACISSIGFSACHIYKVTVTNTGDATSTVSSYIKFNLENIENLKWREISSINTIGDIKSSEATNGYIATAASSSSTSWRNKDILNTSTNSTKTYYIAVWISNLSENQSETDYGTYDGEITFETSNGEVTSTFK